MKTVLTKEGKYWRLDNKVADYEVKVGKAKYVPKSEWKLNVRNLVTEAEVVESVKAEKTKTAKVEKRLKLKQKQRG